MKALIFALAVIIFITSGATFFTYLAVFVNFYVGSAGGVAFIISLFFSGAAVGDYLIEWVTK